MTIPEIESTIIAEFSIFDDWMDRYNYLIELGKDLRVIDEKHKVQNNLITGCQSRVWLHAEYKEGKVYFSADSDAVITKGLVSLMIRVLDGQSPDDILNAELGFLEKIGLKEHLSPTRSNGLTSMVKQMKLYALAFKAKQGDSSPRAGVPFGKKDLEEKIIQELKSVYDPEIPINIYEIGLIYKIQIDDDFLVHILMTLTTPNCPVAESLPAEVREKIKAIDGVKDVDLELTFEPPWDMEMLSEEAKLELGIL